MKPWTTLALMALATSGFAGSSMAEDAYLVGVTAAMTGPIAGAFASGTDGLRIYIDKLNAAGGINGKQIRLIIRDDQSDASKGAANIKRLLEEDNVQLLVNNTASTTYQPTMAQVRRASVPVLFLGVCPTEVYPPAQPLMFCTNSFASHYDQRAALDYIVAASQSSAVDVGILSQSLPISRAEADYAEALSKEMKLHEVDKETLPIATSDFTPFATNLNAAKPQWIWAWIAWELQTGSIDALRRLGWSGTFLGWSHVQAEDDLPRVNDQKYYTIGTNAYFFQGLPVQQDILAAAKTANLSYSPTRLSEGWIGGMAVEAAFRAASAAGPVSAATLATAMETLTIDTKGIRGTPITWTKTNHFRTVQSYRVYHWNGTALETVGDWRRYDVN
jgi:ABC-type branched-subunit amino acid transport system substrate-binding protein